MSSAKWSVCLCFVFSGREFVSRWSSATVFFFFGGKNAAVQSLKHLWFTARYPLFGISLEPQWKCCLPILLTNMLTSCLNIQTLLSHKPCDLVWLTPPRSSCSCFYNGAANFRSIDVRAQRMSRHFVKYVDRVKNTRALKKRHGEGGGKQTSSDKFVAHLVQTV